MDGDGHDDVISGSYWPGDLYVFRGQGGTSYAKGAIIPDRNGSNLSAGGPWASKEQPDMDALASAPFAADWDGDGDLDLLVGNIQGRVILIPNEGTAKAPSFDGASRRPVEAGGKPIQVPHGDSGPVVADWDSDGAPDLVVGAGDGSVWFFRNGGTAKAPSLEAGRAILEAWPEPEETPLEGTEPVRPELRAKVCVVDHDGDGDLDLLVGDYAGRREPERELTPEETARRDELTREQESISEEYSKYFQEKGEVGEDDPGAKAILDRMIEVGEALAELEPGYPSHGWVWLYRRKGP